MLSNWQNVDSAPSRRAVRGTLGLYLRGDADKATSPEAFLLGNEFAHHHPRSDGGLHLVLPPDWHAAVVEKGWAIPHTLAGQPTVSR